MIARQLNLIAVVGRQGFIGNEGQRPSFATEQEARAFQTQLMSMVAGGTIIIGGRTRDLLFNETAFDPKMAPFDMFVWDRATQAVMNAEDAAHNICSFGKPVFVIGGRHTFECFLPWCQQLFITRANLLIGANPLYMPQLFGMTQ